MTIWLRMIGEEGYQLRTVDTLEGLCCEGMSDDGYYLYYEVE